MQKIKDISGPKTGWERRNPNGFSVDLSTLLNRQWRRLSTQINTDNLIVSLRGGGDLIGTALPAAYLYEYRRKMLTSKGEMPIAHLSKHKDNIAEPISNVLIERGNVVLLDNEGRPALGILNKEMSMAFTADAQGGAIVSKRLCSHLFNHESYEFVPKDDRTGVTCLDTGERIQGFKLSNQYRPRAMSDDDRSLAHYMNSVIKSVEDPNARKVIDAVRNTPLTLD